MMIFSSSNPVDKNQMNVKYLGKIVTFTSVYHATIVSNLFDDGFI